MTYVDTWAWQALADRNDPYHPIASRQHRQFSQRSERYVTSDFVIAEFLSALFGIMPFAPAARFGESLFQAFATGQYQLVHVSPAQFRRAWDLRVRYHDKPDISFVDLTSMVVMQDLGIADVFTGDAHFLQVNLGFRLHP